MTARRVSIDDKHYTHTQEVPVTTVVITHNMGKPPAVDVHVMGLGRVDCDVAVIDANSVRVTFDVATMFTAYLN